MHSKVQPPAPVSERPNETAQTEDFEFAALAEAKNYRRALFEEFRSVLRGDVIEVGAGIGQMIEQALELKEVDRVRAIEPDPQFCAKFRKRLPDVELVEGTVADLPPGTNCDAIVCINVLEHICEDVAELRRFADLLRARRGAVCLFVPARPEIYAPIDKDFGHFRRYKLGELKAKLIEAGFRIERLHYFNFVGYFAWWLNFCVLKKRGFEVEKVRAFDRVVFPVAHKLESGILRPPFGQSLLAIARAG
jgi:SAM-dependent methyltransferase